MKFEIPTLDWYSARSKVGNVPPRCPIARCDLCPRYYESLWLLGKAGMTTKVSEEDQQRLDKKWLPFKTVIAEEEAVVIYGDEGLSCVSRFCPEVAFLVFGFFASSLSRYADEVNKALAHKNLEKLGAGSDDPLWVWEAIHAQHYTECGEYSLFASFSCEMPRKRNNPRLGISSKVRWQVFARDSFTCQYCGRRPPDVALELDHRISVANGGSDEPDNLVTSCFDCNRGKGAENSVTEG